MERESKQVELAVGAQRFVAQVPRTWILSQISSQPVAIYHLTAITGEVVQLSILPKAALDKGARAMVERIAAEEGKQEHVLVGEIRCRDANGNECAPYYLAEDTRYADAQPPIGEYRYSARGARALDDASILFSVLTSNDDGKTIEDAIHAVGTILSR